MRARGPARTIRIHGVGDSVTRGYQTRGWRIALGKLLQARGYSVSHLGSQTNGDNSGANTSYLHDGNNGWGSGQLWNTATYRQACDVAIIGLGLNDVGGTAANDLAAATWATNVGNIRDGLLAGGYAKNCIIWSPYKSSNVHSGAQQTRVDEYDAATAALATSTRTAACRTIYSGWVTATHEWSISDLHPNDAGDAFIAGQLLAAGAQAGFW